MTSRKTGLSAVSDSVSSRVSRTLRKAASKKLSAFTLAELVVVITILAVLATIAFLALSDYTEDARDARAKANVRTVHSAISAESALTGNTPRYYVAHDADYALSGAYLYVDGNPVALTGGNVGEAPTDSNYTAGQPRWDRLKLDAEKFKASSAFFPEAFAAFDKAALSAGAVDVPTVSGAGKVRTVSFFQIAGILPDTGAVAVSGDFPAPSAADVSAGESNGKPVAAGLVRNPDAGPTEALADSSTVSAPEGGGTPASSSCGSVPHGGTKTFWIAESVPHGQTCPAGVEFSCDDGSWTHESADKASYPSEVACVVWTPANCSAATVDGYSLSATNHGDATTGTKPDTSFQNGTKNLSQNFLCSNGSFAADSAETGTIVSCSEGYETDGTACVPKSCDFGGQTVAHGASVTAYQTASVTLPSACASETRTCSLGVLSGTYANASCAQSCPTGFVKVPGSATFSTPDFCLAKYEMKFASVSGRSQCGGSPWISCDGEASGDGWKTWQFATGVAYASVPGTTPIADLTQSQAIAACASLWSGYHLVTNDEWMTVARNAESVAANWSGGAVGNGGMFRGNTGVDDALGCDDAGTDHVAAASADNAALSSSRSSCADKRQLKLTNGEIVWDLAGNVWEHVNGANTLDGSNYNTMAGKVCGWTDNWYSFSGTDGAAGGTCSFSAPYSYAGYGPATANMNASNGMGRIYSYPTGGSNRVLLRGSSGSEGDYAGFFTMALHWDATSSHRLVGFRCALR